MEKNPHAVALGRLGGRAGGRRGGLARARALTPDWRREIARRAAEARWQAAASARATEARGARAASERVKPAGARAASERVAPAVARATEARGEAAGARAASERVAPAGARGQGGRTRGTGEEARGPELPVVVARLLKTYDVARLRWEEPVDRWAIVSAVLIHGDAEARGWLAGRLSVEALRELARQFRGAGLNEPERARLRADLNLDETDIPKRPYLGLG